MYATDVSADGRTIVGYGTNPRGETEAWVATIPEPSTFIILAAAFVAVVASRVHWPTITRRCTFIVAAISAAVSVQPVAAQYSFTPASELPGGGFRGTPTAISGDGSTVIGNLPITMGREGFRWNAQSGMIRLGDLPGGTFNSTADDVSYDGSIVVGSSIYRGVISNGELFRGWQPYRWTSESGMVGLGVEGMASAVSADGSVVVGFNDFGSIRWAATEGASYVIGPAPFSNYRSGATDVSADGTTVVGWTWGSTGQSQAFRWTQSAGVASLDPANYAYHISGDGRVVIGYNRSTRALRWTQEDGWTALAHAELYAGEISADGSTIVGLDGSGEASEAIFWTPSSGVVNLREYLLSNGFASVKDWKLTSAIDVSADGRTIVGVGDNPQGQREAWIATIPEPATLMLVGTAIALTGLILFRKRQAACRRRSPPLG
jgi:probable HAF family extracellular repeat protein